MVLAAYSRNAATPSRQAFVGYLYLVVFVRAVRDDAQQSGWGGGAVEVGRADPVLTQGRIADRLPPSGFYPPARHDAQQWDVLQLSSQRASPSAPGAPRSNMGLEAEDGNFGEGFKHHRAGLDQGGSTKGVSRMEVVNVAQAFGHTQSFTETTQNRSGQERGDQKLSEKQAFADSDWRQLASNSGGTLQRQHREWFHDRPAQKALQQMGRVGTSSTSSTSSDAGIESLAVQEALQGQQRNQSSQPANGSDSAPQPGRSHDEAKYAYKKATDDMEGLRDVVEAVEAAKDSAASKARAVRASAFVSLC